MKKIMSIIIMVLLLLVSILTLTSNAAELNTITINTSKTTVHPGNPITVSIDFGQNLGAYTFDIAYDNNLFEYESAEGGTPSNLGDKVRVVYHDPTGGTNPRSNMSVTFKAKTGIITSNPTDFAITATGLANPDASVTFDDITVPITKNVVVEPAYVNYDLSLNYEGTVMPNEEKEMKLTLASSQGRFYDHVRIITEVTKPDGATVTLMGTDSNHVEHDVIESGWGDPSGFGIGGVVNETYTFRGMFTKIGDYTITFKLINRDNSDAVITSKTVNIKVGEEPVEEVKPEETKPQEKLPQVLPHTGSNSIYIVISIISLIVAASTLIWNKKH